MNDEIVRVIPVMRGMSVEQAWEHISRGHVFSDQESKGCGWAVISTRDDHLVHWYDFEVQKEGEI